MSNQQKIQKTLKRVKVDMLLNWYEASAMYLCPQSFSSKNAMWIEKTTTSTNAKKKKTTVTSNYKTPESAN